MTLYDTVIPTVTHIGTCTPRCLHTWGKKTQFEKQSHTVSLQQGCAPVQCQNSDSTDSACHKVQGHNYIRYSSLMRMPFHTFGRAPSTRTVVLLSLVIGQIRAS
jgi:hypothetical protein